eukprot:g7460.t1
MLTAGTSSCFSSAGNPTAAGATAAPAAGLYAPGTSERSQKRYDAKKCELFKNFLRDAAQSFILDAEAQKVPSVDFAKLELTDWSLYTSCTLHDAHGSGEKSTTATANRLPDGKSACDSCHKLTLSLRGAFSYLFVRLNPWVLGRVCLIADNEYDRTTQRFLFEIFGIAEEVVEAFLLLGFSVRPDGSVTIFEKYADREWLVEMLGCALALTFQFTTFCLTRWLSVRRSAGRLAFAWYLKLDDLISLAVREDKGASYATAGYRNNISFEVRYFAVATLASMVPAERLELLLMKDDRMLIHYEEYKQEFVAARRWVLHLPEQVWNVLQNIVGPSEYRAHLPSDVRAGVLSSFAYLQRLAFDAFEELPLCLAIVPSGVDPESGIAENLNKLRELELEDLAGEDLTTRKIWACLQDESSVGFSDIVGAVQKWRHYPFSAKMVEQGHGTFAAAKKGHDGYNAQTVQQKGFSRSFTSCQASEALDPRQKDINKLEQYIEELDARRPQQMRHFHVFCDELTKDHVRREGRVPDYEEKQKISADARTKVKALRTQGAKLECDMKLAAMVKQAREDITSLKSQALDAIFELRSDLSTSEAPGTLGEKTQMQLSSVNYKKADVDKYLAEHGPSLSHLQAKILRAKARMCPNPVDAISISTLDETDPRRIRQMPCWARDVVDRRSELLHSLFKFEDQTRVWYAVASWIKANPIELTFEVVSGLQESSTVTYGAEAISETAEGAAAAAERAPRAFSLTEELFYETDERLHSVFDVQAASCDFLRSAEVFRSSEFQPLRGSAEDYSQLEDKQETIAKENASADAEKERATEFLLYHPTPKGGPANLLAGRSGILISAYQAAVNEDQNIRKDDVLEGFATKDPNVAAALEDINAIQISAATFDSVGRNWLAGGKKRKAKDELDLATESKRQRNDGHGGGSADSSSSSSATRR